MPSIYEKPGSILQNVTEVNNTRNALEETLNPCQLGIELYDGGDVYKPRVAFRGYYKDDVTLDGYHPMARLDEVLEAYRRIDVLASDNRNLWGALATETSEREAADIAIWGALTPHLNDNVLHITSTERNTWNAKQNALNRSIALTGKVTGSVTDTGGNLSIATAVGSLDKADVGLGNVKNIDTTDASNISSGTLNAARIPNLDMGKITTGNLAWGRISGAPDFSAGDHSHSEYVKKTGDEMTGTLTIYGGLDVNALATGSSTGTINLVQRGETIYMRNNIGVEGTTFSLTLDDWEIYNRRLQGNGGGEYKHSISMRHYNNSPNSGFNVRLDYERLDASTEYRQIGSLSVNPELHKIYIATQQADDVNNVQQASYILSNDDSDITLFTSKGPKKGPLSNPNFTDVSQNFSSLKISPYSLEFSNARPNSIGGSDQNSCSLFLDDTRFVVTCKNLSYTSPNNCPQIVLDSHYFTVRTRGNGSFAFYTEETNPQGLKITTGGSYTTLSPCFDNPSSVITIPRLLPGRLKLPPPGDNAENGEIAFDGNYVLLYFNGVWRQILWAY